MKKYILIAVAERDIFTEEFETLEKAQEEMRKQVIESCKDELEEYIDDDMACIKDMFAWVTDGLNHDDYDWKIIELNF